LKGKLKCSYDDKNMLIDKKGVKPKGS